MIRTRKSLMGKHSPNGAVTRSSKGASTSVQRPLFLPTQQREYAGLSTARSIHHGAGLAGDLPACVCNRANRQAEVMFTLSGWSSQPGGRFANGTLDTPSNRRKAIRWN